MKFSRSPREYEAVTRLDDVIKTSSDIGVGRVTRLGLQAEVEVKGFDPMATRGEIFEAAKKAIPEHAMEKEEESNQLEVTERWVLACWDHIATLRMSRWLSGSIGPLRIG